MFIFFTNVEKDFFYNFYKIINGLVCFIYGESLCYVINCQGFYIVLGKVRFNIIS
jgi:hypothetical protein